MAKMTVARLNCLADHEVDDSLPRTRKLVIKNCVDRGIGRQ